MFLFPHNVANWTPFFLLKLFISLFIYLFILFTPSLFFCHQNLWKKKKKDATNPSYLGFFLGSVRFGFDFILFYFILFYWGSEHFYKWIERHPVWFRQ